VEHVSAVELLCGGHFFAAYDARAVALGELFLGSVRDDLVHARDNAAVLEKGNAALLELCEGEIEIANDMEGESVEELDVEEEGDVNSELAQVGQQLVVERVQPLGFPASTHVQVDEVEDVSDNVGHEFDEKDSELKGEEDEHGRTARAEGVHGKSGNKADIASKQEEHQSDEPHVGACWGKRLLLKELDAVLREPVHGLDEEQHGDKGEEAHVELVAEDGHGEAALDDGVARAML
jgi:hypothetical protein